MPKPLFRGVCASTLTPFGPDGRPDLGRIGPHIDWIIADGAHGISPLGSSGEFAALEADDRRAVLEAALAANAGRLPVVAGTAHCTTAGAVELSRHAERAGADALLVVPPYYMAPTPRQVMAHYRRIAEAVSIPIVLYHNIPLTAVDLRTEHLVRLFEEGAIGGVKMSNPEPDRICELLQATGGRLFVYAGIDTVAFEGLCHGAHGWISGIPSIVPGFARRVYEALAERSDLPARGALGRGLRRGRADAAAVLGLPLPRRGGPLVQRDEGGAHHDRPAGGRSLPAGAAAGGALSRAARRNPPGTGLRGAGDRLKR